MQWVDRQTVKKINIWCTIDIYIDSQSDGNLYVEINMVCTSIDG